MRSVEYLFKFLPVVEHPCLMTNYIAHYTKKLKHRRRKEDDLRRLIARGGNEQKLHLVLVPQVHGLAVPVTIVVCWLYAAWTNGYGFTAAATRLPRPRTACAAADHKGTYQEQNNRQFSGHWQSS